MNKTQFTTREEVHAFTDWFAEVLIGQRPLDFVCRDKTHHTLEDALQTYSWPQKRVDIPTPLGTLSISAHSNFEANNKILNELGNGLRNALSHAANDELGDWIRAVLIWGGVFTARGNGRWLQEMRPILTRYLSNTIEHLGKNDTTEVHKIPDLRSNAGTTKVHSLLLPNFVIYDSRVAASLAWLVWSWTNQTSINVPASLRFACMRANSTKLKARSPDIKKFPYFVASGTLSNHHKHAYWNLIANWTIGCTISKAQKLKPGCLFDSRRVEAALFAMGDDLQYAASPPTMS